MSHSPRDWDGVPGAERRTGRPVLERPGLGGLAFAAFAPFPAACFTLALVTDVAYWRTSHMMWQNFSAWLLLAGLVGGVIALIVGAIAVSRRGYGWSYVGVDVLVLLLAFMNSLVHARDGWTAVVPHGLILSALTVLVMVAGGVLWHASSPCRRPI